MQDSSPRIPRQTIYYIVLLLAWTFLSMVASQLLVSTIMVALLGDQVLQPKWTALYDLITYIIALVMVLILPLVLVRRIRLRTQRSQQNLAHLEQDLRLSPTEMGVSTPLNLTDIGLAPVGYITYLILGSLCLQLMQLFPWFDAAEPQDVGFTVLAPGFDRIVAMLALVFLAPIAEELVMRGWLYGKLRAKLQPFVAALLVSLLFGVLHGQWNVGVSVFCLSLVLCLLREITGSIWSGILLHMLNNGVSFYLLYIVGSGFGA